MSRKTLLVIALLLSIAANFVFPLGVQPVRAQIPTATADAGDAPDSTNAAGVAMPAYPGVPANFPTALTPAPTGPLHWNTTPAYWLGASFSAEDDPESAADADGFSNISPLDGGYDNDQQDNALDTLPTFANCQLYRLPVRVTADARLAAGSHAYLNVWADWNRSGDWGQSISSACPSPVSEWAVQNQMITITTPGAQQVFTTTAFIAANSTPEKDLWLRLSLSDAPAPNADGRGPAGGYTYGETEDYRIEGVLPKPDMPAPPALGPTDFTSAPEASHTSFLPLIKRSPLDIALPPGKPNETDVAFIGGSPFGGDKPVVVSAAGGGVNYALLSWRVNYQNVPPVFLHETPGMPGFNVKLQTLLPGAFAGQYHLLLTGHQSGDGNLWLTTWRVDKNGVFTKLDKQGYGANASVVVKNFAIAYRELQTNRVTTAYQIATPVLTGDNKLRLVSWKVNAATGAINGQQDSGDWGNPRSNTYLQAIHQPGDDWTGERFVVSFLNPQGRVMIHNWYLSPQGQPYYLGTGDLGAGRTGVNIDGSLAANIDAGEAALSPLNKSGFMLAPVSPVGSSQGLNTFSNQYLNCTDQGCNYLPYLISNDAQDGDPGYGVSIPAPVVGAFQGKLVDASVPDGSLLYQWPAAGYTPQIIASVTKIMTVIVALDEIQKGNVSLTDVVTVTVDAPTKCGSCMNLEVGERQTLENLLYGLVLVSGNDAGYAIGNYIGGSIAGFAQLMNDKAAELGMSNSIYCDSWGSCVSNPDDQVKLWLSAMHNPNFMHYHESQQIYFACGLDKDDKVICHSLSRDPAANYPGMVGWKGGSGGFTCNAVPNVPFCNSSGCLTAQATRLERDLVFNFLTPVGQPNNNRWGDTRALFNYGYRQIFTPDYVGKNSNANVMPAKDMGLDAIIGGEMVVTSMIDTNDQLKLCAWTPSIPTEEVELLGCATHTPSLTPGTAQPRTLVDMALHPTFPFDGAYVVANLQAGQLHLRYYLVGLRP